MPQYQKERQNRERISTTLAALSYLLNLARRCTFHDSVQNSQSQKFTDFLSDAYDCPASLVAVTSSSKCLARSYQTRPSMQAEEPICSSQIYNQIIGFIAHILYLKCSLSLYWPNALTHDSGLLWLSWLSHKVCNLEANEEVYVAHADKDVRTFSVLPRV